MWKSITESKSGKLDVGRLHSAKKQLASRPDAFGQTQFCTICLMPSLEKTELNWMQEVGSGISIQSGVILAVTAITGHNQNAFGSDPACLLGTHNNNS